MKLATLLAGTACALAIAASALAATTSAPAPSADRLAPVGISPQPAPLPPRPVTETMFGKEVTDNYRYFEKLDAATLDWMRAEGAYTRNVLDAIGPRADLGKRVGAFTGSFGFIKNYAEFGGRTFYQERPPGADNFNLMV